MIYELSLVVSLFCLDVCVSTQCLQTTANNSCIIRQHMHCCCNKLMASRARSCSSCTCALRCARAHALELKTDAPHRRCCCCTAPRVSTNKGLPLFMTIRLILGQMFYLNGGSSTRITQQRHTTKQHTHLVCVEQKCCFCVGHHSAKACTTSVQKKRLLHLLSFYSSDALLLNGGSIRRSQG